MEERVVRRVLGLKAVLSGLMAVVLIVSLPGQALGYTIGPITVTHVHQSTNTYCVPASTLMQLKQIPNSIQPSQLSLYNTGRTYLGCTGEAAGLDPRAWAWLLYLNTPAGYYYDHFKYTDAYSGTLAMLWQVNNGYPDPPGALVNRGHHAMLLDGASTSCRPNYDTCTRPTIYGVYVEDPWWASGSGSTPGNGSPCPGYTPCGRINLAPRTYIAYSTWTSYYYTYWAYQDCSIWNNYWVAVLRKGSGQPSTPVRLDPSAPKDPTQAPSDTGTMGTEVVAPATQTPVYSASASAQDLGRRSWRRTSASTSAMA